MHPVLIAADPLSRIGKNRAMVGFVDRHPALSQAIGKQPAAGVYNERVVKAARHQIESFEQLVSDSSLERG